MTTYYVSTSGSDRGDGGAGSPWGSIGHAMRQELRPGDEVVVRPGTYREAVDITQGGSASGHVTLRSEVPGEALIRAPSNTWNAISVNANYVVVDGFDIRGTGGGDGIEANDVHHVKVLNNVSHGNGESGIQFNYSEFITVEGNTTYGNAADGWFSGISIYQNRNITGDRSTDGFRTIVKDNISYDNVTKTGQHTDGNGIIIDDFQSTQTGGYPSYTFPTLVENNLVYNNGGKGIQVVWSDNVTVRGNTAYHNNLDPRNEGTWRGEISNSQSSDNTWVNNIAVADPSRNPNNTAIDDTSYGGYSNDDVVWRNNLTFDGRPGQASVRIDGNNDGPGASQGNLLGVDPRFVKPGSDFELRSDSPAIDAGTGAFGHARRDLDGGDRTVGAIDIGAHEHGGSGASPAPKTPPAPAPKPEPENRAPEAQDDAGFRAAQETPLRIAASDLLRNDSDPDGHPLELTGVSAAKGGSAKLNGSGDVVFTPRAGAEGEAGFSYTVSDGNGGRATAKVKVKIALDEPGEDEPGKAGPEKEGPEKEGPEKAAETETFWDPGTKPRQVADEDRNAVELGLKFRADVDGGVLAVRFYEGPEADGAHPVRLWSAGGEELARASFAGTSGSGWREVAFDAPVSIEAGDVHVASYHAPQGGYSADNGFFTRSMSDGNLTALKNAGVYDYGPAGSFPDQTYQASNYWVDVVFRAEEGEAPAPAPTPAPTPQAGPTHRGDGGRDRLFGSDGQDVMLGGGGRDLIRGRDEDDVLRGQGGHDILFGDGGADVLIGGKGNDRFFFRSTKDSTERTTDVIRSGDGAAAFEGAGKARGDQINVRHIDADSTRKGDQAFEFGESGTGGLWLEEVEGRTVVRANTDRDAASELTIVIEDGAVLASQYVMADFVL